jgi:hypothetical protein
VNTRAIGLGTKKNINIQMKKNILLIFFIAAFNIFSPAQSVCTELGNFLDTIESLNGALKQYSPDIKVAWKVYKQKYYQLELFGERDTTISDVYLNYKITSDNIDSITNCILQKANEKNWYISLSKKIERDGFRTINIYIAADKKERILFFYPDSQNQYEKWLAVSVLW